MSYRTQFDQTYQALQNSHKKLSQRLSQHDQYESDLLHYIENEKYDAAMGSKLLKRLRENRWDRREIKAQLEEIQRMIQAFDNFYAKKPSTKYHYRIADKNHILDVKLEK